MMMAKAVDKKANRQQQDERLEVEGALAISKRDAANLIMKINVYRFQGRGRLPKSS